MEMQRTNVGKAGNMSFEDIDRCRYIPPRLRRDLFICIYAPLRSKKAALFLLHARFQSFPRPPCCVILDSTIKMIPGIQSLMQMQA